MGASFSVDTEISQQVLHKRKVPKAKDYSTAGSQVVSKLSTGAARRCLTSQIGRDEVLSP